VVGKRSKFAFHYTVSQSSQNGKCGRVITQEFFPLRPIFCLILARILLARTNGKAREILLRCAVVVFTFWQKFEFWEKLSLESQKCLRRKFFCVFYVTSKFVFLIISQQLVSREQ
jgi:hypothetical protein